MSSRRTLVHLSRWLALTACCLLTACGASETPAAGETPGDVSKPSATRGPAPTVTGEIHPAMFAGDWYDDQPDALASGVDSMLEAVTPIDGQPIGLLVPHAGHVFSGPVAAYAFKQIEGIDYDVVVIIGPNHRHPTFEDVSVWAEGGFETPLGVVPVNREVAADLLEADERIVFDREVHLTEHSIEIELPFLQRVCPDCSLVPVVIGQPTEENLKALGDALIKVLKGRKALVVASSDLSHYPSYGDAIQVDMATLAAVETGDPELVRQRIEETMAKGVPNLATCACGEGPLLVTMRVVKELGADTVTILRYANSGDSPSGGRDQVVGYGAVMFWRWEPPALGQADKDALLDIARRAIADKLDDAELEALMAEKPVLARRSAVFVTLLKGDDLRGCIGQIQARYPLAEAVRMAAIDAATEDPRFLPVKRSELDEISIEISVLSPFRRVTDVERDIQVGMHGLLIIAGDARGLLLPQVATEQGFDRVEFLEAVAQKAGLPPGAWQDATLYTFTAEVFGEAD
jgi:AmmeMemoRadiSam system protein B/AmmeMemoRadiSam system protein A